VPIFARPTSDLITSGWSTQAGDTTNLFQSIDEVVENLADYIKCGVQDVVEPYQCGLGAISDPVSSVGHIMTVTAAQLSLPGIQNVLTFRLKQGATQIAVANQLLTNNTTVTYTYTLSAGEANAITNYANLSMVIEASKVSEFDFDVRVYHVFFQVPGFAHLDISGAGLVNAAADSGNILQASGAGLLRVAGTEGVGTIILPTGSGLKVVT